MIAHCQRGMGYEKKKIKLCGFSLRKKKENYSESNVVSESEGAKGDPQKVPPFALCAHLTTKGAAVLCEWQDTQTSVSRHPTGAATKREQKVGKVKTGLKEGSRGRPVLH